MMGPRDVEVAAFEKLSKPEALRLLAALQAELHEARAQNQVLRRKTSAESFSPENLTLEQLQNLLQEERETATRTKELHVEQLLQQGKTTQDLALQLQKALDEAKTARENADALLAENVQIGVSNVNATQKVSELQRQLQQQQIRFQRDEMELTTAADALRARISQLELSNRPVVAPIDAVDFQEASVQLSSLKTVILDQNSEINGLKLKLAEQTASLAKAAAAEEKLRQFEQQRENAQQRLLQAQNELQRSIDDREDLINRAQIAEQKAEILQKSEKKLLQELQIQAEMLDQFKLLKQEAQETARFEQSEIAGQKEKISALEVENKVLQTKCETFLENAEKMEQKLREKEGKILKLLQNEEENNGKIVKQSEEIAVLQQKTRENEAQRVELIRLYKNVIGSFYQQNNNFDLLQKMQVRLQQSVDELEELRGMFGEL